MTATHDPAMSDGGNVVSLAERQRRRRAHLERLLDLRHRLAVTAAEQRAHNLPDGWEHTGLQYSVEATIRDGWPAVYEERFPVWVAQETALDHAAGVLVGDCSICRAIAAHGGVNLQPPDAA